MNRYIDLAHKCGVSTYIIYEIEKEANELFYVKKKLDMRRVVKTDEITICVYEDFEDNGKKYRGTANAEVNPSMSDEEIMDRIKSAKYAAQYVKNPFFEIAKKEVSDTVVAKSSLNGKSLAELADMFVEAAYSQDKEEESFINSFEIFVSEIKKHIVNSNGTDVSSVERTVSGEFVAQCTKPNDVETYQDFAYDQLALEEIKSLVKSTIEMTKDRAAAEKMPKSGTYDVILSDKYVAEIFNFYKERTDAYMIYPGYSEYKIGENIQGEDVKGEVLNIYGVPVSPFSLEGIKMEERPIVDNGVLKTIHGGQRFLYYLGLDQIGGYNKIKVTAGNTSMEEMKKRPCLHVVNFSDFQMDEDDGHYAGEIRLAYYYDGKGNVEFVTGGSVNGSIFDAQGEFVFSKEVQNLDTFEGPKAILLKNVLVAGE